MQEMELTAEERDVLLGRTVEVLTRSVADGNESRETGPGQDQPDHRPIRAVAQLGLTDCHLRSLATMHETVARRYERRLRDMLERPVDMHVLHVETTSYGQFTFSRSVPTCLAVLSAAPLPHPLALDVHPRILYLLLDCLLGGGRRAPIVPRRPLTEIERRLTRRLLDDLLDELHAAWEHLLAVRPQIDRFEAYAQRARLVPPNDPVILIKYQIRVDERRGSIVLCLPVRTIERVADKLVRMDDWPDVWEGPSDAQQGLVNGGLAAK